MSSNKPASKGQVFVIGAIIIVLVLVLIRTSINVADIIQEKNYIEAGLERTEFANLRNEVPKSTYNTINNTGNMTNTTVSFIAFAEEKLAGRTLQFDGVAVISIYNTLPASTDTQLNVTLYNFFEDNMNNAIVNLSTNFNSPATFANVSSGTTRSTAFTLNLASSQNLTMWIFYDVSGVYHVQNVTIPAEIGRSKAVNYYDLRLKSERGTISDRFAETVDVS